MGESNLVIVILVLSLFLFSACEAEDAILDGIFGWMPGYDSSSSDSSTSHASNSNNNHRDNSPDSDDNEVYQEHTAADGTKYTILDNNKANENTGTRFVNGIKNFFSKDDDESDFDCSSIPNSHENSEGTCVCNTGYAYWQGECTRTTGSCNSDRDCGTPSCSGYYKVVPRCDLRTQKCLPTERINCKTDFGPRYTCSAGSCIVR